MAVINVDKLYLCNGLNHKCNNSVGCYKDDGECHHTQFVEFALNPDASDECFEKFELPDGGYFWVEIPTIESIN